MTLSLVGFALVSNIENDVLGVVSDFSELLRVQDLAGVDLETRALGSKETTINKTNNVIETNSHQSLTSFFFHARIGQEDDGSMGID